MTDRDTTGDLARVRTGEELSRSLVAKSTDPNAFLVHVLRASVERILASADSQGRVELDEAGLVLSDARAWLSASSDHALGRFAHVERERDEAIRLLGGIVECFPNSPHPAMRDAREFLQARKLGPVPVKLRDSQ